MSISSIALMAALAALPLFQDAEPRAETQTQVHVIASGGPDGPGRLDADEDGFVTREEFTAPLATAFDRLDENDDGRLSPEEMPSGRGENHGGPMVFNMREGGPGIMMFGGPGGHHGGPGGRAMVFGGADGEENVFVFRRGGASGEGDPDGVRVEIRRLDGSGMPRAEIRHFDGSDGESGPSVSTVEVRRFGGPGGGDMDTNDDGRVTEDEFLAPLREAFQRMDEDRDGALDDGERPRRDR
jgi:hypothetical protein